MFAGSTADPAGSASAGDDWPSRAPSPFWASLGIDAGARTIDSDRRESATRSINQPDLLFRLDVATPTIPLDEALPSETTPLPGRASATPASTLFSRSRRTGASGSFSRTPRTPRTPRTTPRRRRDDSVIMGKSFVSLAHFAD